MKNRTKKKRPKKAYTKLPLAVSLKDFNRYVAPYLSRGKRGPKPKLPLYRIFNYILYVHHTGMQWNELKTRRNELAWQNVYKWHNRWSKDGSYERLFQASLRHLKETGRLDLSVLHGDGSNAIAKKGAKASATPATSTKKEKRS